MISLQEKPEQLVIDGHVESVYVYFRTDVPVKEALRFEMEGIGRVLVYVGQDGIPTAIQFIDRFSLRRRHDDSETMPPELAKLMLFGLASKMVAFTEAGRRRLGEVLIQDAIDIGENFPSLYDDDEIPA